MPSLKYQDPNPETLPRLLRKKYLNPQGATEHHKEAEQIFPKWQRNQHNSMRKTKGKKTSLERKNKPSKFQCRISAPPFHALIPINHQHNAIMPQAAKIISVNWS